MTDMNIYCVPVTWKEAGFMLVKGAPSAKDALEYVKGHMNDMDVGLPTGEYVEDSIRIEGDDEQALAIINEISRRYNKGMRRDLLSEKVYNYVKD